jgi:precorrin-6Y C5,15-methyltransferase (decarboxylating)
VTGHLIVIGCGVARTDLPARHRAAAEQADVLAGGKRLLDWFPDFKGRRLVIGADAAAQVRRLARLACTRRVAVLASGDSLFFGIARLFTGLVPPGRWTVLPNVTAAQAALAQLGLPWERARFFSVHGRTSALPWRDVLRADPAVVYADPARPASALARDLIRRWPAAAGRPAALALDLGGPAARLVQGPLRGLGRIRCPPLSILIVRGDAGDGPVTSPPLELGLPDAAYAHERGLITHPEVRAAVLARLRLGPGVMWDLGAGSGSVGLEASRLCPDLHVIAVEREPARASTIRRNAEALGAPNVDVREGEILALLPRLSPPRSVFVGGGGREAGRIVATAFRRLRPGGAVVAVAVLQETQERLRRVLPGRPRSMAELTVRRERDVGRASMLEADHAIQIFAWEKPL